MRKKPIFPTSAQYINYIKTLMSCSIVDADDILEIIGEATTFNIDCPDMWMMWMDFHIKYDEDDKVHIVFHNALNELTPDAAFPLFQKIMQYYYTVPRLKHKVDPIFRLACDQETEDYGQFRLLYLKWTLSRHGLDEMKRAYNYLVQKQPICEELPAEMERLEKAYNKKLAHSLVCENEDCKLRLKMRAQTKGGL